MSVSLPRGGLVYLDEVLQKYCAGCATYAHAVPPGVICVIGCIWSMTKGVNTSAADDGRWEDVKPLIGGFVKGLGIEE